MVTGARCHIQEAYQSPSTLPYHPLPQRPAKPSRVKLQVLAQCYLYLVPIELNGNIYIEVSTNNTFGSPYVC